MEAEAAAEGVAAWVMVGAACLLTMNPGPMSSALSAGTTCGRSRVTPCRGLPAGHSELTLLPFKPFYFLETQRTTCFGDLQLLELSVAEANTKGTGMPISRVMFLESAKIGILKRWHLCIRRRPGSPAFAHYGVSADTRPTILGSHITTMQIQARPFGISRRSG